MGRPSLLPRSETNGIGPDEFDVGSFGIICVKFGRGTLHLLCYGLRQIAFITASPISRGCKRPWNLVGSQRCGAVDGLQCLMPPSRSSIPPYLLTQTNPLPPFFLPQSSQAPILILLSSPPPSPCLRHPRHTAPADGRSVAPSPAATTLHACSFCSRSSPAPPLPPWEEALISHSPPLDLQLSIFPPPSPSLPALIPPPPPDAILHSPTAFPRTLSLLPSSSPLLAQHASWSGKRHSQDHSQKRYGYILSTVSIRSWRTQAIGCIFGLF